MAPGRGPGVDPWAVLGLLPPPASGPQELRARYRELARQHHPDKCQGGGDAFRRIQAAYERALSQLSQQQEATARGADGSAPSVSALLTLERNCLPMAKAIREQDAGAVMALGPVAFTQELGLGNTALHFAAFYGAAEVLELMLASGAVPADAVLQRNAEGKTPLELAQNYDEAYQKLRTFLLASDEGSLAAPPTRSGAGWWEDGGSRPTTSEGWLRPRLSSRRGPRMRSRGMEVGWRPSTREGMASRPTTREAGRPVTREAGLDGRPGTRDGRPGTRDAGLDDRRPGTRPGTREGGRPGTREGGRPGTREGRPAREGQRDEWRPGTREGLEEPFLPSATATGAFGQPRLPREVARDDWRDGRSWARQMQDGPAGRGPDPMQVRPPVMHMMGSYLLPPQDRPVHTPRRRFQRNSLP